MPSTVAEIGPCKKLVQVNVPRENVKERLEKNYHDLSHSISLPGFRKGKVPRAIIEKRFGKHVEQELAQTLIQETLGQAIEESKLQPIGEPKLAKVAFDSTKDPALTYEATISVRPEFEIPSFEGVRVEKTTAVATDEDVLESLEQSRRARGELKPKGDADTIGAEDFIIADVSVVVDGAEAHKFEKGHYWVKNGVLDGGIEVKDLAEKLKDKKIGDAVAIPVTLGNRFPIDAARGKDATVVLKILEAKVVEMPALDDAFAKDAGFDGLQELKDEVRNRLLRQRDEEADVEAEEKAVELILDRVEFTLPADVVEQELDELALRAQMQARYKGASEQDAAAEAGKVRTGSRAEVERRLKGVFLLDKIAKENKIFATEDEVQQAIAAMAQRYGRPVDEVEAELDKQGGVTRLRFDIRLDKSRKWLRTKVEVVEKAAK